MPEYKNVNVDNPHIVRAIRRMHDEGRKMEDIVRVIGMPAEVVRKHTEQADAEKPKRGPGRPPRDRED